VEPVAIVFDHERFNGTFYVRLGQFCLTRRKELIFLKVFITFNVSYIGLSPLFNGASKEQIRNKKLGEHFS
jgi:hypothetical protein